MKIFTEILKATLLSFIVSYFSFIVQTKYNTCARTRPHGEQFLTSKFYMKEHTKPLFNANRILTVQNVYRYTAIIELIKILVFGHPKSLLETFELSS